MLGDSARGNRSESRLIWDKSDFCSLGEHLLTSSESLGNLEVLEERVGTLNIQNEKKNCGAARKK